MNKTLLISLLLITVFLLIVFILKQRSAIHIPNKKYGIGTITQKEVQKNGTLYHYHFQAQENNFKGTFRHHSSKFITGTRYFVSYNTSDPSQNFLEIQHPTPDSITTIPKNGWNQIPK